MSTARLFSAAVVLITALATPLQASAAQAVLPPEQIKIGDLTSDLQRHSQSAESVDLVWWIPKEFWAAALSQGDKVDAKTTREFVDLFSKYTVVAAVQADLGPLGVDKFTSEEDLRAALRIYDAAGNSYAPIAADKLDAKLTILIQIMRPMFNNILGQIGNNLQFFAFPAKTGDGDPIVDPLGTGTFLIKLDKDDYTFRLPLGSLLAPRHDQATGETFPGSYLFNPYTGAALQTATP